MVNQPITCDLYFGNSIIIMANNEMRPKHLEVVDRVNPTYFCIVLMLFSIYTFVKYSILSNVPQISVLSQFGHCCRFA